MSPARSARSAASEGRRAELTYRGNLALGRHGWLRLTPAYARKVVTEALEALPEGSRVLDPFGGSGTTPLTAAELGLEARATELNPFLVWLGNAKLSRYGKRSLDQARAFARGLDHLAPLAEHPAPPMHNITRWWSPTTIDALRGLRDAIARADVPAPARKLLRVAFCRSVIARSHAAFDHVSMSFRDGTPVDDRADDAATRAAFRRALEEVLEGAARSLPGRAKISEGDARTLRPLRGERFDRVVTSPPYPNRMSYVRELRPYMYWLGYLEAAREAGELDWKAIGGTWGVATSRLSTYTPPEDARLPPALAPICAAVRDAHPKNGPLLARYLERYFVDTRDHLERLCDHLEPGAAVTYVVGNSAFYGTLVPVESLYADLMVDVGLEAPRIDVLRKRNSKKELFEFAVHARRART